MNDADEHGTHAEDMWLSKSGVTPAWVQFAFDRPTKLHEMWVWNSNQSIESVVGFGAKDVTIETSLDGQAWMALENVPPFARATGTADYRHNTTVDFQGRVASFVKLTLRSAWGGLPQYGLSEVRFFAIPTYASRPQPANGSKTATLDVTLQWRPGREALLHVISLGTDPDAVVNGIAETIVTDAPYYDLTSWGLEQHTTYYWTVSEVNEAAAYTTYPGDLWQFSTPD